MNLTPKHSKATFRYQLLVLEYNESVVQLIPRILLYGKNAALRPMDTT